MKKIKKTIATVAAVTTSAVTVVAAGGVINKAEAWNYAGLSYSVEAAPVLNANYSVVRFYYQTGGNQRPDTLYAAAKEYVESLYPDCDVQGPYFSSGPSTPNTDKTLEFWFHAYSNTNTDPEAEGLVKENVMADTGLEVTPAEETLKIGENFQITATKNLVFTKDVNYVIVSGSADSSGSSVGSTRYINQESTAGILSYQSADDSIATVNAEGYVTAQGVGTTTITVTSTAPVGLTSGTYTLNTVNGGSSASNNITVGEPSTLTTTVNVTVTEIPEIHPTDVTMDTPSVTLNGEVDTVTASGTESLTVGEEGTSSGSASVKYGQSAELTASVSPEGADQTVTWSSSDPSVATVNNGVVTAVKAGTATVTAASAADDTKKATSSITVTEPSKDVTWSSSDPSVVEVDPTTGDTTAKAIGTATITAASVADSSKSDSYTVTVAAAPDDTVYPNGISLDSDNYEVEVGGTKQAFVTFDPANTTDKSVAWEITSGTEFASVDADGLIHGLKKGEATLKATAVSKDAYGKEVSATAKVTVTDPDEGRYTVTFVTDHATAPDAVRVNAGEKVTNPGNLAEEGFIFLGWYTDSNHTTAVDWDAPINENKTYYAGWDRETPERITVVFDGNGGTIGGQSSTSKDVEIVDGNATVTGLAPAAERDGYTLTGWNSSADGTGVNIGDVIANAQDKATYTFYAQWEEVYNGPTDFGIDFGTSGGSVKVGESIQLGTKNWSPDGLPAESKEVTWSVANGTGSATIDETGKLTGTAVGTVEVTAASKINPELTRTATVNVLPADAELIEPTDVDITDPSTGVSLDDITLQEGETKQLDAVITPADANTNTGKTWSTADPSVATVDQNGNVTGVKYGTTTVTVTLDNGVQDTATVTVTPVNPTDFGIDFGASGGSVKVGESIQLGTKNWSPDGLTAKSKEVTWSVANGTGTATIDQTGKLTGTAVGTVEVTATSKVSPELTRTATVNVLPADAKLVEPTDVNIVDPSTGVALDDITLQEGETKQLNAVITPADANTNTGKTWSIADPSIATVDQNGKVTAIKAGTTAVTVILDNGVQDTAMVTVTPKPTENTDIEPTGVSIGTKDVYLYVGNTKTLTATITPANANVHTNKTWSIANSAIAVIDQNGTVTGVKAGTTTVRVTLANGVSDTATVHVLDVSTPSYTVTFNGNGGVINGNSTATATADGAYTLYSNSFPTATRSGYNFSGWNTSANGTGTWVSAPYTFKANTTLYAQWSAATVAPTSVDISVPVITANPNGTVNTTYVSADSMSLKVGETKPIKATVLPANATDKSVTYSIADPSIARIDQNGNITGLRAGITTATVRTVNGLTDTITVTVTPNSSMPNLYIEDIKSEYPAGKAIPVALNILDPDRGERLYVYYQIDNETPVLADTITATGNWQDVEVELPSNIAIGKHSFSFFVRDAAGNRSDDNGYAYIYNGDAYITDVDKYNPNRYDPSTWGTRFKADVTNTAPTLSLAAKLQDKVRIGDQLPANLTVKDENVGQKVTIYYQIDSGNPVEAGSFVSDGNAKNISVNVPTAGISEGDHVVTFYAVDEAGMKSNANGNVNAWNALGTNAGANQQTVTFTKGDGTGNTNGGNAPIVDIFKASGYKTTEDVAVTISVLEKDAGQKVTTYYSLDNGPETVIKSFKSTGRANTQQLNLGKLSEGTHTLEVWAIDEDGNRSDAADGLYTFSVSKASDGTVTVVPQPTVYNTSTIKTGVEAKASKAGIAAAVIGAAAAIGTVLKKKRK